MNQIKEMEPTKPFKYSRILFENGTKTEKYWCYQKNILNQYGDPWKQGYFCYTCELFFRWNNHQPFRVHGAFLERKERVNEYGNKVNISYFKALCCKCWDNIRPNSASETLKIGWKSCICQVFINDKVKEANESIKNYNSMIRDCEWLSNELNNLRFTKLDGLKKITNESFLGRRIKDFINQLKNRQDSDKESKENQEKSLILYKNWEITRNNQLQNV